MGFEAAGAALLDVFGAEAAGAGVAEAAGAGAAAAGGASVGATAVGSALGIEAAGASVAGIAGTAVGAGTIGAGEIGALGAVGAGVGAAAAGGAAGVGEGMAAGDLATLANPAFESTLAASSLGGASGAGGLTTAVPGAANAATVGGLSLGKIGTGLGLLSTGYSLYSADQLRKLAGKLGQQSDPFGAWRSTYAQQLSQLMSDPSSVTKLPGYEFGIQQGEQGIQRMASKQGYNLTPREALEVSQYDQQYATQFYNDQIQRLAVLSGATIGPTSGATQLTGDIASTQLTGNALQQLGYMAQSGGKVPSTVPSAPGA